MQDVLHVGLTLDSGAGRIAGDLVVDGGQAMRHRFTSYVELIALLERLRSAPAGQHENETGRQQ